jgi:hypothetical protein
MYPNKFFKEVCLSDRGRYGPRIANSAKTDLPYTVYVAELNDISIKTFGTPSHLNYNTGINLLDSARQAELDGMWTNHFHHKKTKAVIEKRTEFVVCKRCHELGISALIEKSSPMAIEEDRNILLQRFVFDNNHPLSSHCPLCLSGKEFLKGNKFLTQGALGIKMALEHELGKFNGRSIENTREINSRLKNLEGGPIFFQAPAVYLRGSTEVDRDLTMNSLFKADCSTGKLGALLDSPRRLVRYTGDRNQKPSSELVHSHVKRESFFPTTSGMVKVVGEYLDYQRIVTWLKDCSQCHVLCRPFYRDVGDAIRLIDVNRRMLIQRLQCEEFVALSYVWGRVEQPKISNLGKLPDHLPQTIEDAITMVRSLHQNFLWVDSICIDQSDPQEKGTQIDMMDRIYGSAYATIIAVDSSDANTGLPGVNIETPRLPQLLVKFGENYLLSQLPKIADCLNATSSPWATRAWTFQEGLLSRRCILLTRYQAYFSCNTFCRSEDTPDGTGPDQETVPRARLFGMLLNPVDSMMFQKWVPKRTKYSVYNQLVSQFLSRNLTNDGDALNAVMALLNQMAVSTFRAGYIFGLPLGHFPQALLWIQSTSGYSYKYPSDCNPNRRDTRRRAVRSIPSWSWAAWEPKLGIELRMTHCFWADMASGHVEPPLYIYFDDKEVYVRHFRSYRRSLKRWKPYREVEHQVQQAYEDELESLLDGPYKGEGWTTNPSPATSQNSFRVIGLTFTPRCKQNDGVTRAAKGLFRLVTPQNAPSLNAFNLIEHWHLDINDSRIATTEEALVHEYLVVSVGIDNGESDRQAEIGVSFGLILLLWEHDIAYRAGVLVVWVPQRIFDRFWKQANPTFREFWFG